MAGRDKRICSDTRDRISEVPQPLLHNILSFLSQKEAIQTCVLSKSWRYLGSTRTNLEFREGGDKQNSMSFLDKTLQMYHDQNLCMQEFSVALLTVDPESVSLLKKWIPVIIMMMGGVMNTFALSFDSDSSEYFDLPSVVFEAKSLLKMCLRTCRLNGNSIDKVMFTHLQTLSLTQVYIANETFRKIMSSCIFIERVTLLRCEGLISIRLKNGSSQNNCVKQFDLIPYAGKEQEQDLSFADFPNLETINIRGADRWHDFCHRNIRFLRLKSLYLLEVGLHAPMIKILSRDFPCLEDLSIFNCRGFQILSLSNPSIKRLNIVDSSKSFEAAIDAPNIAKFHYGGFIPRHISFTTTNNSSGEWKSIIDRRYHKDFNDGQALSSSTFLELNTLLKAVSHSEVSLILSRHPRIDGDNQLIGEPPDLVVPLDNGVHDKPVLVEYLYLCFSGKLPSSFPGFFIRMLHYCRPRKIRQYLYANQHDVSEWEGTGLTEFLCKVLLMERERYLWRLGLEKASMKVRDRNSRVWKPVEVKTIFQSDPSEPAPKFIMQVVCFKLKWRE